MEVVEPGAYSRVSLQILYAYPSHKEDKKEHLMCTSARVAEGSLKSASVLFEFTVEAKNPHRTHMGNRQSPAFGSLIWWQYT